VLLQMDTEQLWVRSSIDFLHATNGTQNETGECTVGAIAVAAIKQQRDTLVLYQVGEFARVAISGENQSLPLIKWGNGDQTGVRLSRVLSGKHGKASGVEQGLDAVPDRGERGH